MKETTHRLVLFAVIVGTGSVLIFVDIPLIYLIPLIMAVGFLLLILLGSITVAEIKNALSIQSFKKIRQQSSSKRSDSVNLSGKKISPQKDDGGKKAGKNAPAKPAEKTGGIRHHLSLLASSTKSFGKILAGRKKTAKKPEEINKLLEHTITEKIHRGSAPETVTEAPTVFGSKQGGAGAMNTESGSEIDPFLALSGDELEAGLLDDLDEPEPAENSQPGLGPEGADSSLSMMDLEMPDLPDDTAADAEAILKANADDGSDELSGFDGVDAADGTLEDLDSINLDDIDLGDESGMLEPAPPVPDLSAEDSAPGPGGLITAPATRAGGPESSAQGSPSDILSDTAKWSSQGSLLTVKLEEDHSEISAFAAGTASGSDEDMLSSLASDIKHVKKERDLSLLRDLKDFKAPAADIEKELSEMSGQLNTASKGATKKIPTSQGIK